MYGRSEFRNTARLCDMADRDSAPLWSEGQLQAFLSTRTPERWLVGLLGITFALLVLIRLNPELLGAIFG